jgi:hypothetical protein
MLNVTNEFLSEIEDFISLYEKGTITIVEGIEFNAPKLIKNITYYILSKYLDGQEDQLKRRKPFRNIGNAIVDVEFRAKNIDRKAIEASATDGDYVFSLVINKELQQWMRDNKFGRFIDEYQRKKSEFGSVLLKKTEANGELFIDVVKWNNVAVNPKDITGGAKVEKFELSALELRKKSNIWDTDVINEVIEIHKKSKNPNKEIEILDIEGEFPKTYFEEYADADTLDFGLYNVVLAVVNRKKYRLFCTELKESRFKHFKRKSVENRDFGIGVWEEVFEPQIWTNDAVIAEKFAMDMAGKVILKTNKKSDIPSAASLLDGEIIELRDNEYLESMSLVPAALPQFQNVVDSWFVNTQRDQSTFNAVTGEEAKAGVPFAAQALQAAQGGSIFNKRRDDDGFDVEEVLVDWVVPHLIKKINKAHKLTASYSAKELRLIDKAVRVEMNNGGIDALIQSEDEITPEAIAGIQVGVEDVLSTRNDRTIEIPAGYITVDKVRTKVRFNITDEMEDSQRKLNALAVALQNLPQGDPQRSVIVNEMMEISGISPTTFGASPAPAQGAPQAQGVDPRTVAAQPSKIESVLPAGQR